MNVYGLLPWFDERPSWLAACVTSMSRVVDHVIAADGAYQLYPGGSSRSPIGQADAIVEAARAAGVGLTLILPTERWANNEIEKRNALLQHAELLAADDDWLFWLDADMVVRDVPWDLRARLDGAANWVAHVSLWESVHVNEDLGDGASWHEIDRQHPLFIRARAGAEVVHNHWTWIGEDPDTGRELVLRGSTHDYQLEPALDVTDLLVEHRNRQRHRDRARSARQYYELRDRTGVERSRQVIMETDTGDERVVT